MDTLDQRRRGRARALGPGPEDAHYEAALSQAPAGSRHQTVRDPEQGDTVTAVAGQPSGANSSPTMMEMGMAVASPFASDRIHAEVALMNRRPAGLDDDARAIARAQAEASELSLEPDYATLSTGEGARVARVDKRDPAEVESQAAGGPERVGGASPGQAIAESSLLNGVPPVPPLARIEDRRFPTGSLAGQVISEPLPLQDLPTGASEGQEERPSESMAELTVALMGQRGDQPSSEDNRELVPAMGARVQDLLIQMMEENRSLRLRLEQLETQSSWHSQGTRVTPDTPEHSPVSFAPGGVEVRVGQPVVDRVSGESLLRLRATEFGSVGVLGTSSGVPEHQRELSLCGQAGPAAMPELVAQGLGTPAPHPIAASAAGPSHLMQDSLQGLTQASSVVPALACRPPPPVPVSPGLVLGSGMETAGIAFLDQGLNGPRDTQDASGNRVPDLTFHTPRSVVPDRPRAGFDAQGYPISPGGRVIKPPPGPPPLTPRGLDKEQGSGFPGLMSQRERPEEPAKYVFEIPKLPTADIATSAVACGNWIAQVRQIFLGLSPTSSVWWGSVERAAGMQYQRWLTADPVDRLLLDPTTVVADFDLARYQRVESRAVTLMLAAVPQGIRDEAVSNRWLTSTSLLFRIQCVYQPGGSSERSMLLSHLVNPEGVKTYTAAVSMLRRWQQNFFSVRELQATLPDPSLLLKGIDAATAALLSQSPLLGFRVNTFRSRVSLDYNPTCHLYCSWLGFYRRSLKRHH